MRTVRRTFGFVAAIAVVVAAISGAAPALADKRVALVVGNSAYKSISPLPNPANDAKLVAETLRNVGFILVGDGPQIDLDKAGFDNAVQKFGQLLQGADVGLFFFAGHGMQVRGNNYLLPVTANPTREADVDFQMLDTNLVLRQMEGSGTKLNVVILDACRNNPFAGRGLRAAAGGLAQMQAPEGTIVSFATQPGNVAQDGIDGNSPYTKALARAIQRPGLDIFQTFNEIGLQVKQATGGAQQPWVSSSPIAGVFHFVPPVAGATQASAPAPALVPRADPCAVAEAHWKSAEAIGNRAVFEDHLSQFGRCPFAGLARARIAALAVTPPAAETPAGDAAKCAEERRARSPAGASPATAVEFVNKRSSAVRLYWIDFQGKRKFYVEIAAGAKHLQPTYVNHPWVVTDQSDKCFTIHMPERTQRLVEIR